ncbi:MAG: fatty acid desaturase, partial [Bacteroidia bacterium]
MHEVLLQCEEYRDHAVVVEGYFLPYEKPATKPTVVEVLGPAYHGLSRDVHIDNEVLENEEVDEKDEILRQGEEEK